MKYTEQPAFPSETFELDGNEPAYPLHFVDAEEAIGYKGDPNGLTKRELIAAMVLQGLVSKYTLNTPEDQNTVCQLSVELSDNLLKHLKS